MSRSKHYLLVGVGIVAVFATSALMNTRPAAAQNKDASKDAFQTTVTLTATSGVQMTGNFIVPAGKRLVIEHVTAGFSVGVGEKAALDMHTSLDGTTRFHFFVTTPQGTFTAGASSYDVFRVSQPTRIYADGGTPVSFISWRNSSTSGFAMVSVVTVSGTLTNL